MAPTNFSNMTTMHACVNTATDSLLLPYLFQQQTGITTDTLQHKAAWLLLTHCLKQT
jgi:hypothetical protein